MAAPSKFAHVVFNTHRYDEMIDWYAGYSRRGCSPPGPPSCSRRSGVRRSLQRALPGLWSALVRLPSWASKLTLTC